MSRRFLTLAAVALLAGGTFVLAATARATFILTNGERKSGTVVFHGGANENLINGHLNLGVENAADMTFPIEQVAVIDFVGGRPQASELAQLGPRHTLFTRNSGPQGGRFVNMITGDTLVWENEAGQRQQYAISDVTRVYLNPESARTVFNYQPSAAAPASAQAATGGATVRVDARQVWTDTGITVNRGEMVTFRASGQIQIGPAQGETATPDGSAYNGQRSGRSLRYPAERIAPGALIGRIGNSAPFGIGMQTQPLPMPASGRLQLGVNDNDPTDNNGFFTVVVAGGIPDAR